MQINKTWMPVKVENPTVRKNADYVFNKYLKQGAKVMMTEGWKEEIRRMLNICKLIN